MPCTQVSRTARGCHGVGALLKRTLPSDQPHGSLLLGARPAKSPQGWSPHHHQVQGPGPQPTTPRGQTPAHRLSSSRASMQGHWVAPGGSANVSSIGPHDSLNQAPHWPRPSAGPQAVLAGSASLLLPSTTPQRNLSLSRRQVLSVVPGDTTNGLSIGTHDSRDQAPPCPRTSDG